jgi:dolichyl-phosphate beta-glucosyltransferase
MHTRPRISLILPAFNEAAGIGRTLARTVAYFEERSWSYEIIVAADGDDGTREIVAELARHNPSLRVIGGRERLGKGRGVRSAVALAAGEIIGYADADYKVPIEELDKLLPWFERGYQIVTGSRALQGSVINRPQPLYRRLGSRAFRAFMQTLTGLHAITDSQCGFKFLERQAALEIFKRQKIDGYMFDVEILVIASRLGYRIKEVPICWADDGDSRLQLLRGNLRNVIDMFRIRFSQVPR